MPVMRPLGRSAQFEVVEVGDVKSGVEGFQDIVIRELGRGRGGAIAKIPPASAEVDSMPYSFAVPHADQGVDQFSPD